MAAKLDAAKLLWRSSIERLTTANRASHCSTPNGSRLFHTRSLKQGTLRRGMSSSFLAQKYYNGGLILLFHEVLCPARPFVNAVS